MVNEEWKDILHEWSEHGDTKLHFFAEKVLFNCDPSNEHLLDEPIFVLYNSPEGENVVFLYLSHIAYCRCCFYSWFTRQFLLHMDGSTGFDRLS